MTSTHLRKTKGVLDLHLLTSFSFESFHLFVILLLLALALSPSRLEIVDLCRELRQLWMILLLSLQLCCLLLSMDNCFVNLVYLFLSVVQLLLKLQSCLSHLCHLLLCMVCCCLLLHVHILSILHGLLIIVFALLAFALSHTATTLISLLLLLISSISVPFRSVWVLVSSTPLSWYLLSRHALRTSTVPV